jgi:hypothetical protein
MAFEDLSTVDCTEYEDHELPVHVEVGTQAAAVDRVEIRMLQRHDCTRQELEVPRI